MQGCAYQHDYRHAIPIPPACRDGTNDNFSWNCGAEGGSGDGGTQALRGRQMRNFMLALMLSQGTPMIVMGKAESLSDCRSYLATLTFCP